jgi:trimethylamine:corrinoid methyltransferase-like protein
VSNRAHRQKTLDSVGCKLKDAVALCSVEVEGAGRRVKEEKSRVEREGGKVEELKEKLPYSFTSFWCSNADIIEFQIAIQRNCVDASYAFRGNCALGPS